MYYSKILNGINEGDQIGGSFDLASILIDSIKKITILINQIPVTFIFGGGKMEPLILGQPTPVCLPKQNTEWGMMMLVMDQLL